MSAEVHRPATCPYCTGNEVARLYLGSVHLDSCECTGCGARWDENPATGEVRGRATRSSVMAPRDHS